MSTYSLLPAPKGRIGQKCLTKRHIDPNFSLYSFFVHSAPDDTHTDSSWYGRLGSFLFARDIS
jgi:hypothetical protein